MHLLQISKCQRKSRSNIGLTGMESSYFNFFPLRSFIELNRHFEDEESLEFRSGHFTEDVTR